MTERVLWAIGAMLLLLRLGIRRRFARLPEREGPGRFHVVVFRTPEEERAGAALARRYRAWLWAPFVLDALLVPALLLADLPRALPHEQFFVLVFTSVHYRFVLAHFSVRAQRLTAAAAGPATGAVLLSLERRRLRDHTNWPLELVLGLVLASSVVVLFLTGMLGEPIPTWLLYLQLGLVLLKQSFVGLRLRLPVVHTEEYVRWRAAWLRYHLRIFDAWRLCAAGALAFFAATFGLEPSESFGRAATAAGVLGLVAVTFYATRERRRLAVVEGEIRPTELARHFPPLRRTEGRYHAGGLVCYQRGHPSLVLPGPDGIALNLANPALYLWSAYLFGLALLLAYQAAR